MFYSKKIVCQIHYSVKVPRCNIVLQTVCPRFTETNLVSVYVSVTHSLIDVTIQL